MWPRQDHVVFSPPSPERFQCRVFQIEHGTEIEHNYLGARSVR